jgi:DNA replication protein DnaC
MPTLTAQMYFAKESKRLREKIAAHNIPRMTAEERVAFVMGEKERDARALAEYQAEHPNIFDPKIIGLNQAELSLDWCNVQAGISDGMKAVAVIQPALKLGHGLIFLWGGYGQAKTLIGKILVARAYAMGKRAAYANFMEALDNIRLAFDEQEGKTTELIRRIDWWTGRDVLFLDEFDKCNDTAWATERKFQIVDRCYQRAIREEALTIIASNHGDNEVDGYIRSRLQDKRLGPVIYLDGKDARKVMPKGYKN